MSSTAPPIALPPYPIGVDSLHTQHQDPAILRVQRHHRGNRQEFEITDAFTSNRLLHMSGKTAFTFGRPQEMVDGSGKPVTLISIKAMPYKFAGVDPSTGKELFVITKPSLYTVRGGLLLSFTNATTGRKEELHMRVIGGLASGEAEVTFGDLVVGRITKSPVNASKRDPAYQLTVAPRVEYLLIVALCLALENRRQAEETANLVNNISGALGNMPTSN